MRSRQYGLVMETVVALGFLVVLVTLRAQEVTKVKPQTNCPETCQTGAWKEAGLREEKRGLQILCFVAEKAPSQCPLLELPRTRTAHKDLFAF